MEGVLDGIARLVDESGWLAPVFAFLGGVLTSFTPCSLSSIPLVVGYVGGTGQREPKKALALSATFAAGAAVTFTALGAAASLAGRLVGGASPWWYIVLGALMVLMALQTWGVVEVIPSSYLVAKNKRTGYAGAFIAGVLGGVFSSPCSTPVLVALLAIVAGKGSVVWGILLLLLYSAGHGALAVAAGTAVGLAQKLSASGKYGRASGVLKAAMGAAILLIGLYMFYLGF